MKNKIKNHIDEGLLHFHMNADEETVQSSLKEDLKDYSAYQEKKEKILKRLRFLANSTAKQERNERLVELANKFKEGIINKSEKPINILKKIIEGNGGTQVALYSNLEKLTEDDIYNIIQDKNFIEILEELDSNETTN